MAQNPFKAPDALSLSELREGMTVPFKYQGSAYHLEAGEVNHSRLGLTMVHMIWSSFPILWLTILWFHLTMSLLELGLESTLSFILSGDSDEYIATAAPCYHASTALPRNDGRKV